MDLLALIHNVGGQQGFEMAKTLKKKYMADVERAYWRSISSKLKVLEECGIHRRPGITPRNVVSAARSDDDPRRPKLNHLQLLVALGFETKRAAKPLSDNVFFQDAGYFYVPRQYKCLVQQLRTLAHPHLPLKDIRVTFEDDAYVGHLSFRLDGRKYTWRFKAGRRYLDFLLCMRFARLLASRKSPKRLTYYWLDIRDFLIGCVTPEQKRRMKAKTGICWVWFEDLQIP